MKPSKECIELIKNWEGYHRKLPNGDCQAYDDVGSDDGEPITIGYGTTRYGASGLQKYGRAKVLRGDVLTQEEAEKELMHEVDAVSVRTNALGVLLNRNEHSACVSFFFNAGFPAPMVERLKRNKKEFCDALDLYIKGGNGKPLQGLINRRNEEQALFLKPVTGEEPRVPSYYYLICKNGLFFMHRDNTPMRKIRSHSLDPIITKNIMPHDIVVDWERDVRVGEEPAPVEPEAPKPDYSIAKLTRYTTDQKMNSAWTNAGLNPLKLEIGDEEFLVVSGQGYAQNFRKFNDPRSRPGNMEPIPEGSYGIEDIEWASGKDNYSGSFGEGLGPVWVGLPAQQTMARSAFGIHIDQNMTRAPGSAGCVVLESVEQAKAVVAALRKFDPRTLVVDWS